LHLGPTVWIDALATGLDAASTVVSKNALEVAWAHLAWAIIRQSQMSCERKPG